MRSLKLSGTVWHRNRIAPSTSNAWALDTANMPPGSNCSGPSENVSYCFSDTQIVRSQNWYQNSITTVFNRMKGYVKAGSCAWKQEIVSLFRPLCPFWIVISAFLLFNTNGLMPSLFLSTSPLIKTITRKECFSPNAIDRLGSHGIIDVL